MQLIHADAMNCINDMISAYDHLSNLFAFQGFSDTRDAISNLLTYHVQNDMYPCLRLMKCAGLTSAVTPTMAHAKIQSIATTTTPIKKRGRNNRFGITGNRPGSVRNPGAYNPNTICKFWKNGFCRMGDNCRWKHPKQDVPNPATTTTDNKPPKPDQ